MSTNDATARLAFEVVKTACSNCNLRELCMPVGLSPTDLDKIDEVVAVRRKIKRGAALFRNGENFTSLYAIRTGFFKTCITTQKYRPVVATMYRQATDMGQDATPAFVIQHKDPNNPGGTDQIKVVLGALDYADFAKTLDIEIFRAQGTAIPDFKLEKPHIDLRIRQMEAEGVTFRANQTVGGTGSNAVSVNSLLAEFDALILAGGAEAARDLPVPGRDLAGVHFAMEFLPQQNKVNAGDRLSGQILATGKRVVVIGGGDTGSDCVGTSNRQGAVAVTQFELMPQPPEQENKSLTWPYWPLKLRTSSSHEEGCARDFAVATKAFLGKAGKLTGVRVVRVDWSGGTMSEVAGSEFEIPADLVLLAMGFVSPVRQGLLEQTAVALDARGNVKAATDGVGCYATNVAKVFAAGDMRRGQSLVVWAIREGRLCARSIDTFLMGKTDLPR
jgi:thioredoxin reductase